MGFFHYLELPSLIHCCSHIRTAQKTGDNVGMFLGKATRGPSWSATEAHRIVISGQITFDQGLSLLCIIHSAMTFTCSCSFCNDCGINGNKWRQVKVTLESMEINGINGNERKSSHDDLLPLNSIHTVIQCFPMVNLVSVYKFFAIQNILCN